MKIRRDLPSFHPLPAVLQQPKVAVRAFASHRTALPHLLAGGHEPALLAQLLAQLLYQETAPLSGPLPHSQISKDSLLKSLRAKNIAGLETIEYALVQMNRLPAAAQDRNLHVAFKLMGCQVSPPTIAAALLAGCEPATINHPEVSTILEARDRLVGLSCAYNDKSQVHRLRDLFLSLSPNHEVILLIGCEDHIDLETFTSDSAATTGSRESKELEKKGHRAFFVTSWLLKYLAYSEEGGELEDLGLLKLDPEKHSEVEEMLKEESGGLDRAARTRRLNEFAVELTQRVTDFDPWIKFRTKMTASAAERLAIKGNVRDGNGLRIILPANNADSCYEVLRELRRHFVKELGWAEDAKEFDDYIKSPKENSYQSIHVVFCENDKYRLEIQVRTEEMDRVASIGDACHGGYKAGVSGAHDANLPIAEQRFASRLAGLRASGTTQVLDGAGYIHKLVTGAPDILPTALDAAFAGCITLGLTAKTIEINGVPAELGRTLQPGDVVVVTGAQQGIPASPERAEQVATAWGRACLRWAGNRAAAEFTSQHTHLLEQAGRTILVELVRKLKEEKDYLALTKGWEQAPKLEYSLERLYKKRGFSSEKDFFETLALLSEDGSGAEDPLFEEIRNHIRHNLIIVAAQFKGRAATLEMVTADQPGVLYRLAQMINDSLLQFKALTHRSIPGAIEHSRSHLEVVGAQGKIRQLLPQLHDLYQGLPLAQPEYGRVHNLKIRLGRGKPNIDQLLPILDIIQQLNLNISHCELPASISAEGLVYEIGLQAPKPDEWKVVAQRLDKKLTQVRGINSLTFS